MYIYIYIYIQLSGAWRPCFTGPADCSHCNCNHMSIGESRKLRRLLVQVLKQFVVTATFLSETLLVVQPVHLQRVRVRVNPPTCLFCQHGFSGPENYSCSICSPETDNKHRGESRDRWTVPPTTKYSWIIQFGADHHISGAVLFPLAPSSHHNIFPQNNCSKGWVAQKPFC